MANSTVFQSKWKPILEATDAQTKKNGNGGTASERSIELLVRVGLLNQFYSR